MSKTRRIFSKINKISSSKTLTEEEKKDIVFDLCKLIHENEKQNPKNVENANSVSRVVFESLNIKPKKRSRKKQEPPEYSEFQKYANSKSDKVDEILLRRKYLAWKENDWRDGHHKPIKNWKTKLLNTLQYLESNEKKKKYNRTDAIKKAKTLFGKNS